MKKNTRKTLLLTGATLLLSLTIGAKDVHADIGDNVDIISGGDVSLQDYYVTEHLENQTNYQAELDVSQLSGENLNKVVNDNDLSFDFELSEVPTEQFADYSIGEEIRQDLPLPSQLPDYLQWDVDYGYMTEEEAWQQLEQDSQMVRRIKIEKGSLNDSNPTKLATVTYNKSKDKVDNNFYQLMGEHRQLQDQIDAKWDELNSGYSTDYKFVYDIEKEAEGIAKQIANKTVKDYRGTMRNTVGNQYIVGRELSPNEKAGIQFPYDFEENVAFKEDQKQSLTQAEWEEITTPNTAFKETVDKATYPDGTVVVKKEYNGYNLYLGDYLDPYFYHNNYVSDTPYDELDVTQDGWRGINFIYGMNNPPASTKTDSSGKLTSISKPIMTRKDDEQFALDQGYVEVDQNLNKVKGTTNGPNIIYDPSKETNDKVYRYIFKLDESTAPRIQLNERDYVYFTSDGDLVMDYADLADIPYQNYFYFRQDAMPTTYLFKDVASANSHWQSVVDGNFRMTQLQSDPVTYNLTPVVVEFKDEEVSVSIDYNTQYEETTDLLVGQTKVKQEGVKGSDITYYTVKYISGVEDSRQETGTKQTPAVDEIILVGIREESVDVVKEVVPYETIRRFNDTMLLEEGDVVVQAGVNGEKELTYQVTSAKGKELSRDLTNEEITTAPVDEIIEYGNKVISSDLVETPIPYEVEVRETTDLLVGEERVTQAGVNGLKTETYKVTSAEGKEISRELVDTKIANPVNEIKEIGIREESVDVVKEEIPHETIRRYNPELYWDEGDIVVQDGVVGEKELTYNVTSAKGKELSRVLASEVITTPPVDEIIEYGDKKRITYTEEDEIEVIPFEIIYEDDPTLALGLEELRTQGVDGYIKRYFRLTWVDGAFDSKELIREEIQDPTNQVIARGTYVEPEAQVPEETQVPEPKTEPVLVKMEKPEPTKPVKFIEKAQAEPIVVEAKESVSDDETEADPTTQIISTTRTNSLPATGEAGLGILLTALTNLFVGLGLIKKEDE